MSDMLGRLLYDNTTDGVVTCYYVTTSATLLSTTILDLLRACLGTPLPSLFDLLSDLFTDTLEGIADGIHDAAKAKDVLDVVPEFLLNGTEIPTIAYLQGGTPQYYVVPASDLYLKDVEIKPVTLGLLVTDLDSLEFFGVRACKCLYVAELKPSDGALPENILVQDSASGNYTVFRPPYGDYNGGSQEESDNKQIAGYDFNLDFSFCLCASVGGLWGEEPMPAAQGHYLNPFQAIQLSSGSVLNGVYFSPFLSSSGIQVSVPFTLSSPSASTVTALKWERYPIVGGERIGRDGAAVPYLIGGGGAGGVVGKKPKRKFILEKFGGGHDSSVLPVSVAAMGLCWLQRRRRI